MQKNHFEVILESIESKMQAVLEIVADQPTRSDFNEALRRIDDSSKRLDAHQIILEFHSKAQNNSKNTLKRYSRSIKSLEKRSGLV